MAICARPPCRKGLSRWGPPCSSWRMQIEPLQQSQPRFARGRGDRGRHGQARRAGPPGQDMTDEQQTAFTLQLRRAAEIDRTAAMSLKPDDGQRLAAHFADVSNLGKDGKPLAARRPRRMFNLGNRLWHSDSSFRAIPAKYSLLSGRIVTPEGRQHRVRRHARGLRRARRRDQGRDRGPGLRAFADPFARLLGFTDFPTRREAASCSSRCCSAWCAPIR
jgi:hypothetical protein